MKKVDYYIIGNGGCAKDVYSISKAALNENEHVFRGFIDYKPSAKDVFCLNEKCPLIDEKDFLASVKPSDNIQLYMGIANPGILEKLSKKFSQYLFPNLIHPSVIGYFPSITMGNGNIVAGNCSFTGDIEIGNFNMINQNVTIAHDVILKDFNVINPAASVSGGIKLSNSNLIGTNATILQYLEIGSNNILGAGSVLLKNMGNNEVWVGNPAKKIKDNV